MIPAHQVPDAEKAVRALLTAAMASPTCTVAIDLPADWTPGVPGDPSRPASPPHVQPQWDGTNLAGHQITATATVRVVVWAATKSLAKDTAARAQALLLAHDGTPPISTVRPGVGPVPARDPDTRAEMAWFTVRVTVRTTPLT